MLRTLHVTNDSEILLILLSARVKARPPAFGEFPLLAEEAGLKSLLVFPVEQALIRRGRVESPDWEAGESCFLEVSPGSAQCLS